MLKTLKSVTKIDGFDVYQDDEVADGKWEDVDPKYCVCVHHGDNTVSFRIQDGRIEGGTLKNGCQVDTMIAAAAIMLHGLDKDLPCQENKNAFYHLKQAITELKKRTKDREERSVEGTSER